MPKAIFLEFDGVLAETAQIDRAGFNAAFRAMDVPIEWDEALFARIAGTPGTRARLSAYFERFGWPLTRQGNAKLIDQLVECHTCEMVAAARSRQLTLRRGVAQLIDTLHNTGAVLAVVSEVEADVVATCLAGMGLSGATKVVFMVCSGQAKPKPAPEPYHMALQQAGVAAGDAVAVESSPAGLRAAKAAGLRTIGVGNGVFPPDRLSQADQLVSSIETDVGLAALTDALLD